MVYRKSELRDIPTFFEILAFTIVFLLTAIPVHAGNVTGPYFTLTGSINTHEDMELATQNPLLGTVLSAENAVLEVQSGLGFNHAIGYKFEQSWSTELEFSFMTGDFDVGHGGGSSTGPIDGDFDTKSILLNVIYFFDISEYYSPYVGYGIGVSFQEARLDGHLDGEDKNIAYQFKMGVDFELSSKLGLLIGYRFFTTDDPDFGFFTGEITSHSLEAGIKYYF